MNYFVHREMIIKNRIAHFMKAEGEQNNIYSQSYNA